MTGPQTALLSGVRVGHWTDARARTGCSVVLLPEGTVASGEARGGAPGTREWALLAPERTVDRIDAVVLTGGSAFGLAAADGVMRWCEERGRGWVTSAGRVPIVVGLVLYDLDVGDAGVRPGPTEGYAACAAAAPWPGPVSASAGMVGAGTGATVARWRGPDGRRPGGVGVAERSEGNVVVGALVVVNAVGETVPLHRDRVMTDEDLGHLPAPPGPGRQATTIGVVVTNARLDKIACLGVAQSGHDGLARALDPVHTAGDGDGLVAAATGQVEAGVTRVRLLATAAVEDAVRRAAGAP